MKKLKRIESDSEATELYVVYYSPESGKCIAPTPKKKKVRDTITYTTSDNNMISSNWLSNNADKIISHTYENGVGTIVLDVDNVTNMSNMFASCRSLTSVDLSSLDTSNVTDMNAMFAVCESLTSIDLSSLDTSNVTNMSGMFASCGSLTSIDVSSFDTSNVTDMGGMFISCLSLTSVALPQLDNINAFMERMFNGCYKITSITYNNVEYTTKSDLINAVNNSNFNYSYITDTSLL